MAGFQHILVATDFSESGNHVIDIAVGLCEQSGAVLHLMHVKENRYIISNPAPGMVPSSVMTELDENSRTLLYNIYESILRDHQVTVQIHMPTGIPFDEICKATVEMPIDLVILGTHGLSGVREFFIGTTAYSVIKNSTVPVLTVPASFTKPSFKNILFPVRPVRGIKAKYDLIAPFLEDADVFIHLAILKISGVEEQPADNEEDIVDIMESIKTAGIAGYKETYDCKSFSIKVLQLARLFTPDLIVINSTLDYKQSQFFIGPYTQQVINHARVPVLSFNNGVDIPEEAKKETAIQKRTRENF